MSNTRVNPASGLRTYHRVAYGVVFASFLAPTLANADSFGVLPASQKQYIKRVCMQVNYLQSAESYRECVNTAVLALPSQSTTAKLTLDYAERLPSIATVPNVITDVAATATAIGDDPAQPTRPKSTAEQSDQTPSPSLGADSSDVARVTVEPVQTPAAQALDTKTLATPALASQNSADSLETIEASTAQVTAANPTANRFATNDELPDVSAQTSADPLVLEKEPINGSGNDRSLQVVTEDAAQKTAESQLISSINKAALPKNDESSAQKPSTEDRLKAQLQEKRAAAVAKIALSNNEPSTSSSKPPIATTSDLSTPSDDSKSNANLALVAYNSATTAVADEPAVAATVSEETKTPVALGNTDLDKAVANDLEGQANTALALVESKTDNVVSKPIINLPTTSPVDSQTTVPTAAQANTAEDNAGDEVSTPKEPVEAALDAIRNFWTQLKATFQSASDINQLIMLAALALPFCLIGFWLLMRGRKKQPTAEYPTHYSHDSTSEYDMDETTDATAEKISRHKKKYADQVDFLFDDDTNSPFDDTNAHGFSRSERFESDDLFVEDEFSKEGFRAEAFEEDEPKLFATPPSQTAEAAQPAEAAQYTQAAQTAQSAHTTETSAHTWLSKYDPDERLSYAIEFMIYWMAYTDERFEPELKESIFSNPEPDEHDLIKRMALGQDVNAFAETTSWLQSGTTSEQKLQVLKLLMALLVVEEGLTPVQNTMLRFLSNAFGISHDELDTEFQIAFGHFLPAMPRPDKPIWWEKQPDDKPKRWDARSVARQSPAIQSRVKLGQALTGRLIPDEIDASYARAEARCAPDNFNQLTKRERVLAERQQEKFESAYEVLAETLA